MTTGFGGGESMASVFGVILGLLVALIVVGVIVAVVVAVAGKNKMVAVEDGDRSYFDGGYLAYIGYSLLVGFVTIITFGIAFPWMTCLMQRWKAKHTVICGKRMYFDGTGLGLIGKYILWLFLSIITFGIYGLWMAIAIKKWTTKHTHFVGEEDNNSYFDGGVLGMIGTSLLANLVMCIPFVGFAWSDIIRLRWETRHTVVDSRRLIFNGRIGDLFVKYLLWGILSAVTFGIFAWFVPVKALRWQTEQTIDNEHTPDELLKQSEYRTNLHTDATAFKTYQVEDEMEGVKAGITETIEKDELLRLAQAGNRAAQYQYVTRYSEGQYTAEPFAQLLKGAAAAKYAPAMALYAETAEGLAAEEFRQLVTEAAEKGQAFALTASMGIFANEALAMKQDASALETLQKAIRYGELYKESGGILNEAQESLLKQCILTKRKIKAAIYATGGKSVAAIIAAAIAIPLILILLLGVLGAIFGFRKAEIASPDFSSGGDMAAVGQIDNL